MGQMLLCYFSNRYLKIRSVNIAMKTKQSLPCRGHFNINPVWRREFFVRKLFLSQEARTGGRKCKTTGGWAETFPLGRRFSHGVQKVVEKTRFSLPKNVGFPWILLGFSGEFAHAMQETESKWKSSAPTTGCSEVSATSTSLL